MSVTYKDIDQLSQKPSVVGTEKIPVSDTQYLTPNQISSLSGISTDTTPANSDFAISDENGHRIVEFYDGHIRTKNFDSSLVPKYVLCADQAAYNAITTKDSGTLYLIPKTS